MNSNPAPTKSVKPLADALHKRGIECKLEHSDGHKHVDIAILKSRIFIEVDGSQHVDNAEQIMRDFKRDHFSDGDDFSTLHVSNLLLNNQDELEKIANAIADVARRREE